MVTLPLLVIASGLKGSNLPPSGFSESASGFLSGGFAVPSEAAKEAEAISIEAAAALARVLNRLLFILISSFSLNLISHCRLGLGVDWEPVKRTSICGYGMPMPCRRSSSSSDKFSSPVTAP